MTIKKYMLCTILPQCYGYLLCCHAGGEDDYRESE